MPVAPHEDYYAVLGVHAGANDEELRRAWRTLAAQYHPDRAGLGATPFFQRLSCAYEILSNPVARARYDRKRGHTSRAPTTTPKAQPQPATTKPSRPEVPGVMLSRLSGSIVSLVARGAAHFDEPGYITLVFNQAEAAQGGMITISMRVDVWCPTCAATKPRPPTGCARCEGKGTVEELFSAWLAVPPGVTTGEMLTPSVELPGMVEPVRFRVQVRPPRPPHGNR